jgi:hypothetical protein
MFDWSPLQTEAEILLVVEFYNRKGNHVLLIGAFLYAQI